MSAPERRTVLRALRAAFPRTIPILAGFLFIGLAYGVYMNVSGFSFLYPAVMSVLIFGGSLEFLAVSMLLSKFAPLSALLVALMVQARHLFYGIAMLDKYRGLGWKRPYLIYGLCDETFSINCTAEIPDGVDRGWFYFFVTLLNQLYWFAGATLGGLLGSLFTFNTDGLDFVMTAMFVVIFIDQCRKEKQLWTALIGLGSSIVCLLVFGADTFIIPSMVCIFSFLVLFRKPIAKAGDFQ